jgi:hypothetical protein
MSDNVSLFQTAGCAATVTPRVQDRRMITGTLKTVWYSNHKELKSCSGSSAVTSVA